MGTRRWEEKAVEENGDRVAVGKPSVGGKRPKRCLGDLGDGREAVMRRKRPKKCPGEGGEREIRRVEMLAAEVLGEAAGSEVGWKSWVS